MATGLEGTFYGGWLAQQQANRAQDQQTNQNNLGNLGMLAKIQQMQQQKQIQEIMAGPEPMQVKAQKLAQIPGGIEIASKIMQLDEQQRGAAVFSPENVAANTTGGIPAIPARTAEQMPAGVEGPPVPDIAAQPAVPGQINFDALRRQSMMTGPKAFEAGSAHIANEETRKAQIEATKQSRRDALETRLYDIQTRSEDRALTRQQQENLARMADATRRELAAMGDATRRETAAMSDATRRDVAAMVGDRSSSKERDKKEQKGAMADYAETLVTRLETLLKTDPRSTTGLLSGITRGMEAVVNTAAPGAIGSQATVARQTKEQLISVLGQIRGGGQGRLSNQDMRRVDTAIGQLSSGTPEGMAQGLSDARELINAMKGHSAPATPAQPGMRASDQDLINKYLKPK